MEFFSSPDYLKGGTFFIQAGEIYKQLKIYDNSINCYNEAIKCLKKLKDNIKNCTIVILGRLIIIFY